MRNSFVALGLFLGLSLACDGDSTPPDGNQACTEEAKVCPDGSAVGRTGPNCEFAPCPTEGGDEGGVACTQDAKMCPDGTGVGRTGPNCEFAPCPGESGGDLSGGEPAVCTRDAKVCADGSSVGRTGPDCEFTPCPGE